MSKINASEPAAVGDGNQKALSVASVDSTQSNTVPIYRPMRLGSITSNSTPTANMLPIASSSSSTRPISIPSNPNDIFLFKGFLPLDKNSFPSHFMFNCNTLEGVGFLPDQMFQLFSQILAYEYIRKGQTIPNSVMCGLTYFQEIYTLRKRRMIPNEILPRERQITTSMGAPLHSIGSTNNNLTFIQHVSSSKHPGIVSAKPISESLIKSNATTNPPQSQETSSIDSTSQTSASTSNNIPLESNGQSEKSSTITSNSVNSTTPPSNDEKSNTNLPTINREQQLTKRTVKPLANSLETNLTLIGLEACSYLCDSFPEGNAKFKELLITPIVNHLTITSSSNNVNSSDVTSSSSSISDKQPEKAKETPPKNQKPSATVEVITVDDETPKKTIPTKKTNYITTSNVARTSRKAITTPKRQCELSSSDEESPEVVAEENKKRKRKVIATKKKKKEKKSKKNHLGNDIYTVEKVLRKKIRESSEPEYLVKWKGYGEEDNSWVKESDILDKGLIQNFRGTVEYEKKSK